MKTRHLLIIFVVLFLVFIGIWIVSPNVGERVEPEKGVDVEFNEQNDDLPTNLPEGFVRYKNVTEAVVYRKDNGDGTVTFFEYVGDDNFAYYDLNRPSFFVKSSFDKRIYQVKNFDGTLREEYRAFDGEKWTIVSKTYEKVFEIPSNHLLMTTYINLYLVKDGENLSYKVLTKLGDKYAWVTPTETTEWIETTIPETFEKTEIPNVYKGKDGENVIYKKVLSFNDSYKTIAVVSCDETGKFI